MNFQTIIEKSTDDLPVSAINEAYGMGVYAASKKLGKVAPYVYVNCSSFITMKNQAVLASVYLMGFNDTMNQENNA